VSHELASILSIGDDCVFLDIDERTITARGNPKELLERSDNENVRRFLTRGGSRELGAAEPGAAT
jgi:phospholipid/cholesterol/gamma-HCH transport system ATP-binding protein